MTTVTCSGVPFVVTPTNPTNGIVPLLTRYTWNEPGFTGTVTGGASATDNVTTVFGLLSNRTNETQTVTYIVTPSTAAGCTGTNFTVTVTLNPTPEVNAMTTVTCSGVPFNVTPTNEVDGIVPANTLYSWPVPTYTATMTGGASGTNVLNRVFGTLRNTVNTTQTATYLVRPRTAAGCVGITFVLTVTVPPTAEITTITTVTCSGVPFVVTPTNLTNGIVPDGSTYSWNAPTFTGTVTGGASATDNPLTVFGSLSNRTNTVQTVTYRVTPMLGNCTGAAFTVIVTLQPTPEVSEMTRVTCSGLLFTASPVNGTNGIIPIGTRYSWSVPEMTSSLTGGESGSGQLFVSGTLTNSSEVQQVAVYTVNPILGNCSGLPFTLTVFVNPTAIISAITTVVCSGYPFVVTPVSGFNGNIIPAGTTYRWNVPTYSGSLTGGVSASGQLDVNGKLTNTGNTTQTATYIVTPSTASCNNSTSFTVTVTVTPTAVINQITTVICSGLTFMVTPTHNTNGNIAPGTLYRWSVPTMSGSLTGGESGENVTNISGTLFNPSITTEETATYIVTPTSGNCEGRPFTLVVRVSVNSLISEMSTITCTGVPFVVSPVHVINGTVPANTTYSWDVPVMSTSLSGGQSANASPFITGTLVNSSFEEKTATYTVRPQSGGCTGIPFTLTVYVKSGATIFPMSTVTCSGIPFELTPTNGINGVITEGTTFRWLAPTGVGFTGGATQTSFVSSIFGQLDNTTNIVRTATYAVVANVPFCGEVTSFSLTVFVNPIVAINTINSVICSELTFTVNPTDIVDGIVPAGTTYTWTAPDAPNITGGAAESTPLLFISGKLRNETSSVQTATYTVTPYAPDCGIGNPFTLIVTVNPLPAVNSFNVTTCSGVPIAISPVDVVDGMIPVTTLYSWNAPAFSSSVTGGQSGNAATHVFGTLFNNTNVTQTAVYVVVPKAGDCAGASFTVNVVINPTAVINEMSTVICSRGSFNLLPVDLINGIVPDGTLYSWNAPAISASIIGGQSADTQVSVFGTLFNTSNEVQTATYTVVPTTLLCGANATFTVTVTVKPLAEITAMSIFTCGGATFTVEPTEGINGIVPAGTNYTWLDPVGTGFIGGMSQTTPVDKIQGRLINLTSAIVTAVYYVTPVSDACVGDIFTLTVLVNPVGVINEMSVTTCAGVTFAVSPQDGINGVVPPNTNYKWAAPTGFGFTGGMSQDTFTPEIFGTLINTVNYTVTATYLVYPNDPICGSIANPFTVTVYLNPAAYVTAMTAETCTGVVFTVTPTNIANGIIPDGTTYTWTEPQYSANISGGNTGSGPAITGTLLNSAAVPGTATYTVTPITTLCGINESFTLEITVNPYPSINAITTTICTGITFEVSPVNGVNGSLLPNTTYTWDIPTYSSASMSGGVSKTDHPFITGNLENFTDASQFGTYIVFPTYRGCTGASFTVVAEILPIPRMKDITILTGVSPKYPFVYTPTTNAFYGQVPTGTIYRWDVPTYSSASLTGGESAVNQTNLNGRLEHKSTEILKAFYTVTPTSLACGDGAQFTLTVRVAPLPFVDPMTVVTCSESNFAITPTNDINGIIPDFTTYTWSEPVVTGGMTGGASATDVSNLYGNLYNPTNTTQTATYIVTPKSFFGYEGEQFTLTVTVNPIATINEMSAVTCDGVEFIVSPAQTTNGVVPDGTLYKWNMPTGGGFSNVFTQTTYVADIRGTLVNDTNIAQTATYTIQTISGDCIGKPFTTVVSLKPSARINPITLSYCTGATFTITPTNGNYGIVPDGTLYTWSAPTGTGFSGGEEQLTPTPAIFGTLNNFNTYEVTATYTINAISGDCIGKVFTTTIYVRPAPQVQITLGSQTVCLSTIPSTLSLDIQGGAGAPSYTWFYNTVNSYVGATQLSETTSTFTPPAPDNLNNRYYFAKVFFSAGECQATSMNIHEVRVNRYATSLDLNVDPVSVCAGLTANLVGALSTTSDIVNPIYRWYRDANLANFAFEGPAYTTPVLNNNSSFFVTVRGTNACNNLPGTAQKVDVSVSTFAPTMVQPVDIVTCINNLVSVQFTSVTANTTFSWTNTNTAIGLAGSGTGNSFSFVAQNSNSVNETAYISVVPLVNGCSGIARTFSITVSPAVPAVGTLQLTTASGERVDFNPITPQNGYSYTWTAPLTAGITGTDLVVTGRRAVFNPLLTNTTLAPIIVPFTVQPYSVAPGFCTGSTFMILVTVNPVPTVPDQSVTTCSGLPIQVSPAGVPDQTTYTWDLPLVISGNVTGMMAEASPNTNFNQVLTNLGATDALLRYTVVPVSSGIAGRPFTITVRVLPNPSLINKTPVTVCNKVPFNYTAQSLTVGTTFSWSRAAVNNISNPAATGTNTINETLINTSTDPVQVNYVFTLSANGCSNTETLPVVVYPSYKLTSSLAETVCSNATFHYVATTANNASYSWSRPAVVGISNAAGSGNSSVVDEKLINTTNAPIKVKYLFSLSSGPCADTDSVIVTVNPLPVVNTVADVQYCSGTSAQILFTGSGVANTTYEWTNTFTGIGLFTRGTGDIIFVAINNTNAPVKSRITVTPVANGCQGAARSFTITVNPNPVLNSQLNIPTVCSGTAIRYTPTSSVAGATFNWTRPAISGIDNPAASGSGNINEVLTNSSSSIIYVKYIYTTSANGCSSTQVVNVAVNPTVKVNNPGYQLVCANSSKQIVFVGSTVSGTQYTWTSSNPALGIPVSGIGNIFFIASNNTADSISSNITVTPRANGCNGTPVTFRVTINPLPVLSSALTPAPICSNSQFTYAPTSNVNQTIFNWVRPAVNGLSNSPAVGTGAINEKLINNTTVPVIVTYQITLINNGCTNRQNVTVVVNPALTLSNTNFNYSLCSNQPFRFVPQSVNPANQYQWRRDAIPGISNATATGSGNINETLVNTTNAPIVVTYRYSLINPSPCATEQLVFVTVRPLPVLSSAKNVSICSNVPVGYDPIANLAGSSFSWSRAALSGIANPAGVGLVNINERLINTTTANIDVKYIYTISNSNGCSNTDTVTVQVKPVPVAGFVSDISICANTTTTPINFSSNIPGTIFNWVNSQPAINLPSTGIGNILPFTAQNNTSGQLIAQISVTPEVAGCKGNTIVAAKITVNKAITNLSIQTAPTIACPGVAVGPFIGSVPFGGDGYSYAFQWQSSTDGVTFINIPGAIARSLTAPPVTGPTTWYRLNTVSGGCVANTTPVRVNEAAKPVFNITLIDGNTINVGNSTQAVVEVQPPGAISYEWSPRNFVSNYLSDKPFLSPTTDTRFTVKVTNSDGCIASDSVLIRVIKGFQIYPNNVLTPNGDGYNDTWKIKNIEFYPKNNIKIYNANGANVISFTDYQGTWDGKVNGTKLPTGTYYYMIDLADGSAIIKGFLTILN
jgi:gliding motility-associated-like protein